VSGGDTVFFGTGLWRNSQIQPPSGASFSDRTCYACSAFVRGICNIWGSDSVTGWTQYSGNVYRASWTGSGCYYDSKCYTLGQGDSIFIWVSSIGAVNAPGKFYHDQANNYLYAHVYDEGSGYDPDNYDMEASCKHVVDLNSKNQSHTTFWGMGFRWGKQGIVFFGRGEGAHPDSIFIDHCYLHGVSHITGENASCVFFANPGGDTITGGHYNRVRACSLGAVYNPSGNHASAICMYGETYLVVESCYVYRPLQVGINFKNDVSGFIARNNIARFNTIKGITSYGVVTYKYPYYDSIYGNVIIGDGVTERAVSIGGNSLSPGGHIAILNNTFYNCADNTGLEAVGDGNGSPNSVLEYNVFFDSTTSSYFNLINTTAEAARWTIDSNVYYDNSTYLWQVNWGDKTLSEWRSQYNFDVHSDTGHAKVGLNNPQGRDFSRPSSSQEMNITYGGRTWTRYGAWQPDQGPANQPPQINAIQCEKNSTWVGCSQIHYGETITRVRANVTDADGTISSVRFRLVNLPDNHEFFNGLGSSAGDGWYVFNNNDLLIQDGGDFRLTVTATDDDGAQTSADSTWLVPWGTLSANLISPTQDSSVYRDSVFTFQAQVTCLGGECGDIDATLDPTLTLDETTGLEDTYISINYDQNADSDILCTYTWPPNMVANAILMKWDISSLAGLNIEDARLYLYLYDAGGDNPYTLTVHKIINHNPVISVANGYTYDGVNGWTPNNQCYNNIPLAQADIGPAVDVVDIDMNPGYKSFDVTALIQGWQANPESNHGLLINSDPLATSDSYRYFHSQEYTNINQRPYMAVTCSEGSSKGAISDSIGATPFYTTSGNPQTQANMRAGDVFNQAWQVVPTGVIGENYEFFVINHPTSYSTYINDVESPHISITIIQPNVPAPPQAIDDLMATISRDSVLLTWSAVTTDTSGEEISIHGYVIYRGTEAYFDPTPSDSIGYTDSNTLSFVDPGIGGVNVVGDVDTNYYYVVKAVDIYGNYSDISNRVGEYDYEIVVTPTTDFSYVTLPFTGTGITDADDLISSIGASNINNVSRFIQSSQSYEARFAAGYGSNFPVVPGGIYQVNAKSYTIWSIAGAIPHADSINYSIITAPTTDFSFISIPFEDEDIYHTAQDVIDSLPGALNTLNNFIPSSQSWQSRFAAGYGPNFAVKPGGVYQANAKASATFPPGE
jgi:hypothetical protein